MASRGHKLVASDASAEMQDNPPGNPSSMRRAYRLLLEDTKLRPPRTVPQRSKPNPSGYPRPMDKLGKARSHSTFRSIGDGGDSEGSGTMGGGEQCP